MKYVWIVDDYNLDDICEMSRQDLREVALMFDGKIFSNEAIACRHAAEVRSRILEDINELRMADGLDPVTLMWDHEHEKPNYCWHTNHTDQYADWTGHVVRVTRVLIEDYYDKEDDSDEH